VRLAPPEIRRLFNSISPHYDLLNSLLSLGQHRRWKRLAAALAQVSPGGSAADFASGTGDIALALAAGGARVVALDFSSEMVARGRRRAAGKAICYVLGDALQAPLPDRAFDAATTGFTLRNVASRARLLAEMVRVVRPGGWVVMLETSQPPSRLIGWLYRCYLRGAVVLAFPFSRGHAYRYLARSAIAFPGPETIAAELRAAGLQNVGYRRLLLGTVAVHVGRVGEEPGGRPA